MSFFWRIFKYYNKPFRGLLYMPARWSIVPFEQIESYLPNTGVIVDIGCGEGILSVLIALTSAKRKVIGIDLNEKKVGLGKLIAKTIFNLTFEQGDVLKVHLPKASGFVLSDFLHHIPSPKHKILLRRLMESLENRGVIIIKEIDLKDGLRSKVSRLFDFLFYPFERVNFINSDELTHFLNKLGLKIRIIKMRKWFPGSTTLFICRK